MPDSLDELNRRLLAFARARDWEQFHSPKNLAMALAGECGELLEHFQWLSEAQSAQLDADKKFAVGQEMADILIYLIRLAELLARTTPVALKAGDGAVVGALTGIVAAVVQTLLSIPLRSFNLDLAQRILDKAGELGGEMPAGLDGFFQGASATLTPGWLLLGLFFSAALFGAFGALGGIIGVSLFAKKAVPPQAPATPSAPPQGPPDAA